MIVFVTNKFFQNIIGLQSSGPASHCAYMIAPILISIPMVLLEFSILLNSILNINDNTNSVWSTLPITIALFVFIILYWYLVINHRRFYSLFDSMQDIVSESAWKMKKKRNYKIPTNIHFNRDNKKLFYAGMSMPRNKKLYMESQQQIKILTSICACTSILIPIATLIPFIVVLCYVSLGKYTLHSWFLCYPLW